jgi:3-deoxy-D-manno-octulosonic-acid transferase
LPAARILYTITLFAATPLIFLYLLYRSLRQPAYRSHWLERLGRYAPRRYDRAVIWLHAVSVGETRAALPLVAALLERHPECDLLITHMTPTGRAVVLPQLPVHAGRVTRAYLAYDYPFAVRRFLRHFRPRVGLLMETELWPNLLAATAQARLPVVLVNGRLSPRSFRRTERYSALARPAYAALAGVLAQDEADAARFRAVGATRVQVTGNLKFDADVPADQLALGAKFRSAIGARRVFLCASTREGEEKLIVDALVRGPWPPEALVVIVPRHPQRFEEVAALLEARGLATQRRSILGDAQVVAPVDAATRVWLGDSMGEMIAYYRAADVSYIGGGLLPYGTHNLIEACAVGCPVLLGPHTFNFAQASADALAAGAALQVRDVGELLKVARHLLAKDAERARRAEAAVNFAMRHRGATERTLACLAPYLGAAPGEAASAPSGSTDR